MRDEMRWDNLIKLGQYIILMKKVNTSVAEKKVEKKSSRKKNRIKFNLSPSNLACFKGKHPPLGTLSHPQLKQSLPRNDDLSSGQESCLAGKEVQKNQKLRSISSLTKGSFNEKVVILEYGNIDVYVDNSTKKKSTSSRSGSPVEKKPQHESQVEGEEDQFVSSCVRVITQETDNTSEPYTTYRSSSTLTPKVEEIISFYPYLNYYPSREEFCYRNKRSVTMEESKAFQIQFSKIEADGRTTIMVKNIPNKYSQETLLEQFSVHHDKTFDFFYLPIDKDNQCNVGYAFVNFINTAYIKSFYTEFHGKRWKRYNSAKICNLCYARYQGTLELANHFRHTKILHQKDRKLRPLIGLQDTVKIKQIVQSQRNKE